MLTAETDTELICLERSSRWTQCCEPAAVAHFQSARWKWAMAGSLIHHRMGCHSLSSPGARSLLHLSLYCRRIYNVHVECCICTHVMMRMRQTDEGCLFLKNFQNSFSLDFQQLRIRLWSACVCSFRVWLTVWQILRQNLVQFQTFSNNHFMLLGAL